MMMCQQSSVPMYIVQRGDVVNRQIVDVQQLNKFLVSNSQDKDKLMSVSHFRRRTTFVPAYCEPAYCPSIVV